jgi:hypothetical protein
MVRDAEGWAEPGWAGLDARLPSRPHEPLLVFVACAADELPSSLIGASFSGNPCALRDDYRVRMILALPRLQVSLRPEKSDGTSPCVCRCSAT